MSLLSFESCRQFKIMPSIIYVSSGNVFNGAALNAFFFLNRIRARFSGSQILFFEIISSVCSVFKHQNLIFEVQHSKKKIPSSFIFESFCSLPEKKSIAHRFDFDFDFIFSQEKNKTNFRSLLDFCFREVRTDRPET